MRISLCIFILFFFCYSINGNSCNSSELFDVLLRDFWLLQFGHSYLGGQLPDTEEAYTLAVASCKVYKTQFERHRFLLQACFLAGEHKATTLQHRMAGLCNPKVIELIKPNLACLRSIYASKSYDVCMASALQQLAGHIPKNNQLILRYSDAPYHCINVRQSIMCSQHPMHVNCDGDQLNNVQLLFDTVWANNAVVEGHFECPLRALTPFERKKVEGEEQLIADRRRLNAFCKSNARSASDPLVKAITSYPVQLVRELLVDEKTPILSDLTTRLASYTQCSRVALLGTNRGGRGTSFSPMHDWMSILETFLNIAQEMRRQTASNSSCVHDLLSRKETTPCFQCSDKISPSYILSDYRYHRFSFSAYVESIIQDNDPLSFCRATLSLIKFLSCLVQSAKKTCNLHPIQTEFRIEALRNETSEIYACPRLNVWYADLELMPAYDEHKVARTSISSVPSFCGV